MSRSLAALAVLGTALWLPQGAVAQSAMCVEPAFSGIAPALRGGAMSDAAPVERSAAQPELPAPLRDEELPWCTGADDPRCAPLHGDSTALRLAVQQPLAAATTGMPASNALATQSQFTPFAGSVPHAGIRHRVERPPRGTR